MCVQQNKTVRVRCILLSCEPGFMHVTNTPIEMPFRSFVCNLDCAATMGRLQCMTPIGNYQQNFFPNDTTKKCWIRVLDHQPCYYHPGTLPTELHRFTQWCKYLIKTMMSSVPSEDFDSCEIAQSGISVIYLPKLFSNLEQLCPKSCTENGLLKKQANALENSFTILHQIH